MSGMGALGVALGAAGEDEEAEAEGAEAGASAAWSCDGAFVAPCIGLQADAASCTDAPLLARSKIDRQTAKREETKNQRIHLYRVVRDPDEFSFGALSPCFRPLSPQARASKWLPPRVQPAPRRRAPPLKCLGPLPGSPPSRRSCLRCCKPLPRWRSVLPLSGRPPTRALVAPLPHPESPRKLPRIWVRGLHD
jgi:hypothetical protein